MVHRQHFVDGIYICIYINIFCPLSRASLKGQATETIAPFMYFGGFIESSNISKRTEIK